MTVFIRATLFLQVGMLIRKPKYSENNIGSIQLTLRLLTNRFSLMHFHRPILYIGQNIHAFSILLRSNGRKRAMWAPSVIKNEDHYYFFFGANDIQSDKQYGGIGVAIADNPAGPFRDHLGHPLIAAFHNGAQPIDQFAFRDRDGTYYLIYGGWRHCNIVRLKNDFTGLLPFDDSTVYKEITPEGYVEGPFMFYRNGKYYFMWSEGGWTGPNYSVAYAIGDTPFGPFKRVGKILQQDPAIATGAGHHSVINVPGTDEWYIVYHRRPLTEKDPNSRVTCIDHMYFDKDGYIKPVVITTDGVRQIIIH